MAKRNRYTDEQRQARRDADKALQAEAADLLGAPDAVAALAERLAEKCRSPKVLRYSLRNQALLMLQADARGLKLTDVDNFRGWQERGRIVRKGESGLRIVRPRGVDTTDSQDGDEGNTTENPQAGEHAEADQAEGKTRFRMMAVFDISQTDGVEDLADVGEAHEVPNPAALLADTLTSQLERWGYQVLEDDETTRADVDDGDRVTVPTGRPVGELARALAVIIGAAKAEQNPSTYAA